MKIYIGADHRGFATKQKIKQLLEEQNVETIDTGAETYIDGDNYVDYAKAVGQAVATDPDSRGIVICGSGVGVDMVANKIPGIRSGLGIAHDQIMAARKDDDINMLAIAADYTMPAEIEKMVLVFLSTPFSSVPRYQERLHAVAALERKEDV